MQQPVGHEIVQIDQKWISGESGRRLIRRVPIAGGAHWEHLPVVLTGVGQSMRKQTGVFAQRPDPMGPRERCDVGEYAALAGHPDLWSSGNWANRTTK